MGRISKHVLRVSNASKLASWYNTVLGMDITETQGSWTASYPGVSTALVFKVYLKACACHDCWC